MPPSLSGAGAGGEQILRKKRGKQARPGKPNRGEVKPERGKSGLTRAQNLACWRPTLSIEAGKGSWERKRGRLQKEKRDVRPKTNMGRRGVNCPASKLS